MAALELNSQTDIQGDRQMRELTFKELDAVSGGWPAWAVRIWKKVICRESDDVVNSLSGLNNYVRETTQECGDGTNKKSHRNTTLTVGGSTPDLIV